MKKIIFTFLLTLIFWSASSGLFGQIRGSEKRLFRSHPIDVAVGNVAVGMPFSKIAVDKLYPIATLWTEFYYWHKKHGQIYQTAKIGGYYTKYNTSALFVNTETGYRYTFGFGLFADANLGVGYSHLFRPNAIYKSTDKGGYEQIRDWGKPSLMSNFLLSAGYDLSKSLNKPVSFFVRYGNYVQLFSILMYRHCLKVAFK